MKVLVDTSIWIHFFKDADSIISHILVSLLRKDAVYIWPPILQEILQGASSKLEYNSLSDYFSALRKVKIDTYHNSIAASEI